MDWPRSLGYFGGTGLAVATGLIDPPLGLFIATVPFLRMLDLPDSRVSRASSARCSREWPNL